MVTTPETTDRVMGGDQRLEVILATAEQLFFEKGYRGVSIRDLADAVGIKMSSLYYYFRSKEEILYRIIKRHLDDLLEAIDTALATLETAATPTQRLQMLVRSSVITLLDDRLAAGISVSQTRELNLEQQAELGAIIKRYEARFIDIVRAGMARGEFIGTDATIACYVMLGALIRLNAWYSPEGRLTPEEIADMYTLVLVRGIVADPGTIA